MNITVFADKWCESFLTDFTSSISGAVHRFDIFRPYEGETVPPAEQLSIAGFDYDVREVAKYDLAVQRNDIGLFNSMVPGSTSASPEQRLTAFLMFMADKLRRFMKDNKSQALFLFNPIKADRLFATMVARSMYIPVISMNPEPFPGYYWIEDGAPQHTGFLSGTDNWDRIKRCKFTDMELAEYNEWRAQYESTQQTRGQDWLDHDLVPPDLSSQRPFVLIIGQMKTDANQIMFQRNLSYYPEIIADDILRLTDDCDIYYKGHPMERPQDEINWTGLATKYPGRVVLIVKQMNLHTYLKAADRVVTWNSNAGIEALAYHKPLAVLGEAFYRNHGFTFDLDRITDDAINVFMGWQPDTHHIEQYLKFMMTRFLVKYDKDYWGDRVLERINSIVMDTVALRF